MLTRWLMLLAALAISGCSSELAPEAGFRNATQGMISAAHSSDGKLAVIGSFNHGGSLWQLDEQERLFDWNHDQGEYTAILAAAFSEDNRFVATTDGVTLAVWDTTTGQTQRFWRSPQQSLAINNTGEIWSTSGSEAGDYWNRPARIIALDIAHQYALLGQENNVAVLINVAEGYIIGALHHDGPVSSVALDSQARFALTGSHDGSARVWDLSDGRLVHQWQQHQPIDIVKLSDDGRLAFAAAYQGPVVVFDSQGTDPARQLYSRNPGITAVSFARNDTELLLGTQREKILLWDLTNQGLKQRWQVPNDGPWHKAAILAISSSDDYIVASASNGMTWRIRI